MVRERGRTITGVNLESLLGYQPGDRCSTGVIANCHTKQYGEGIDAVDDFGRGQAVGVLDAAAQRGAGSPQRRPRVRVGFRHDPSADLDQDAADLRVRDLAGMLRDM